MPCERVRLPLQEESAVLDMLAPFRVPDEGLLPSLLMSLEPSRESLRWRFGERFGSAPAPLCLAASMVGRLCSSLGPTRCSRSEADRWSWWAAATGRYDSNTDTLVLSQEPIDEEHTTVLEKVALSHGIQRSVKMARIENNMDELVASLKSVPAHMMRGWVRGDAPSARRQIMQKLGEILHLRDAINLQVPPRAAYHTHLTDCKRRDMSHTLAPLRRHNRPHGRGTFRGRMDRGRSRSQTRIGTCMRSQTSTIASPKSQAPSPRTWRSDLCMRSPAPAPWQCRAGAPGR